MLRSRISLSPPLTLSTVDARRPESIKARTRAERKVHRYFDYIPAALLKGRSDEPLAN